MADLPLLRMLGARIRGWNTRPALNAGYFSYLRQGG